MVGPDISTASGWMGSEETGLLTPPQDQLTQTDSELVCHLQRLHLLLGLLPGCLGRGQQSAQSVQGGDLETAVTHPEAALKLGSEMQCKSNETPSY